MSTKLYFSNGDEQDIPASHIGDFKFTPNNEIENQNDEDLFICKKFETEVSFELDKEASTKLLNFFFPSSHTENHDDKTITHTFLLPDKSNDILNAETIQDILEDDLIT